MGDGTAVGGCSFMLHVRHAVAALPWPVLNGAYYPRRKRSFRCWPRRLRARAASLSGQFEMPFGPMGPPTLFTLPVLRYMKDYGMSHEQLAMVAVVQRQWASMNPRASFQDPITVDDVLASKMIAYPFHLLECCL